MQDADLGRARRPRHLAPMIASRSNPKSPFKLEQKDRLEIRKNCLQLRGNLHSLQSLQLVGSENGGELGKKSLLRLRGLLLQRVNLNDHRPDLCRVCSGVQQITELLGQRLHGLHQRYKLRLAGLE